MCEGGWVRGVQPIQIVEFFHPKVSQCIRIVLQNEAVYIIWAVLTV